MAQALIGVFIITNQEGNHVGVVGEPDGNAIGLIFAGKALAGRL